MEPIYHITTPVEWDRARTAGQYVHPSLEAEGFIHLSPHSELVATTERHYEGVEGLILLEVDPAALPDGVLLWEHAPQVGRDFPHVYGPIPADAVTATHPWDPTADGRRTLPPRHS